MKGRVVDQDGEVLSEAAIKVEFKDEVKVMLYFVTEERDVSGAPCKWCAPMSKIFFRTIQVAGIEKDMVTTSRGEYWRLLMPGTYHIR